jgi:hypothetical protein
VGSSASLRLPSVDLTSMIVVAARTVGREQAVIVIRRIR